MFCEGLLEVYGVSFGNVFNAEVVNEQAKHDWASSVSPKPRCEGSLVVVVGFYKRACTRAPDCGKP